MKDGGGGGGAAGRSRSPAYDSHRRHDVARVLAALAGAHGGAPISEAQVASRLGIDAEAVRGHVAELRTLGYRVRSTGQGDGAGRAYRLGQEAAPLALPWEVIGGGVTAGRLATRRLGSRVVFYRSVDSTQARALDMALSGAGKGGSDGLAVIAGTQTAGRGRGSRRWTSPEGGLWMSVVAEPGPPAGAATLLPLAAALALAGAVRDSTGIVPDLKWPNDMLVRGRKVAGILVDASARGGGGPFDAVVVGVGVNLAVDAAAIGTDAGPPHGHAEAASLLPPGGGGGRAADPASLARAFLERLEAELDMLEGAGRQEDVVRRWSARSSMIGRTVEVRQGGRPIKGTALGVDADGALLVGQEGREAARVVAGDIAVRIE